MPRFKRVALFFFSLLFLTSFANAEIYGPPEDPFDTEWMEGDGRKEGGRDTFTPDTALTVTQLIHSGFPTIVTYVDVVDENGDAIPGLTEDDFCVYQDGVEIGSFTVDSILGDSCITSVCLVMDISGSMCFGDPDPLIGAKQAAHEFVNNMDPFDRVAIVTFSDCVDTLIDFTSDQTALHNAINTLSCQNRTAAFDGIWLGVDLAATEIGSKAVIAFTDGQENNSQRCWPPPNGIPYYDDDSTLICDKANAAGIPIYTIGLAVPVWVEDMMEAFANGTGGFYTYAPSADDMEFVYTKIKERLCKRYIITYNSPDTIQDGDLHEVVICLNENGTCTFNAESHCDTAYYQETAPPSISLTPPTEELGDTCQPINTGLEICADIVDMSAPYIQTVKLFYKTSEQPSYTSVIMNNTSGDTYCYTIPDADVACGPEVQYYITASDGQQTVSDPPVNPQSNPHVIDICPNELPVCSLPSDTTIFLCDLSQVCLPVSATDTDGTITGCAVVSGPGSVSGGNWCYTPTGSETVNVTIECSDDCGDVCQGSFTVEFLYNQAPVCNVPDDAGYFVCADTTFAIPIGATDPDGNLSGCAMTSGPGSFDGSTWTFTTAGPGAYTGIFTCTDDCGESCTDTLTITVSMNSAPVCVIPDDQAFFICDDTTFSFDVSATDVDNNLSGCAMLSGPGSFDGTTWTFTAGASGDYVAEFQCEDECGAVCGGTLTISITKNEAPVLTCPPDIGIVCSESSDPSNTGMATATDDHDPDPQVSYTDSETAGSCVHEKTIARTWIAVDECGDSTTCVQTITVSDEIIPVITCPADISIDCTESTDPSNTGTATATDNCSAEADIVITYADVPSGNTIQRTWTATDECGNYAQCVQTITIEDTTPPTITCPGTLNVQCLDDVPAADIGLVTADDDCDDNPVVTHVSDVSDGNTCPETITRTYKATDAYGNEAECTQLIVINDDTPPTVYCPLDITIDCLESSDPSNTGAAAASDNCSQNGDIAITYTDAQNGYVISRTWTATDECDNSSQCVQTITIEDTTPPTITCPGTLNVQCLDDVPAADIGLVTADDDCDDNPVVTHVSDVSDGNTCPETITRTYSASDDFGNTAQCTQLIVVNDDVPPTIYCPPDLNINCAASTDPSNTGTAGASDNCSQNGDVVITYSDVQNGYVITRTWVASDECGNSSQCEQTITIEDNTPPQITCPDDVDVECYADIPPVNISAVTVSDDCDADPDVVHAGDVSDGNTCPETITRTYMATDDFGNSAQCDQIIVVNDITPPVISCPDDMTIDCTESTDPSYTGFATATDNCTDQTLIVIDYSDVQNGDVITRTWTAADECGNVGSCLQTITILPNDPPVCVLPDDQTFFVCGDTTFSFDVYATDDQDVTCVMLSGQGSYDGAVWTFTTGGPGVYAAEFECTDECDASCVGSVAITVEYNSAPYCEPIDDMSIFQCSPTEICLPVVSGDDDNNLVSCEIVSGPGAMVNGEWCYTPAGSETVDVTIKCTDECGEFCEESFQVEFNVHDKWAVISVDRSGSMSLTNLSGQPRLDRARLVAHDDIDKLLDDTDADYPGVYQVAVMYFNNSTGIVLAQDFTDNSTLLHDAVNNIPGPKHDTPLAAAMCQSHCMMPDLGGCIRYLFTYTDGLENASQQFDMCTLCQPCDSYMGTGWNYDCDPNNPASCTDWQMCLNGQLTANGTNIVHYFGEPLNPFGKDVALEDLYFLKNTAELSDGTLFYYSDLELPDFTCGDANGDYGVNVSDAVYIINYVFVNGPAPDPMQAANVNCDSGVNVSDAVWIINYVFVGGPEPCADCPMIVK